MASALKNLSDYNEENIPDASTLSFGIILSEWNTQITHALYEACYDTLVKHKTKVDNIHTIQVPGAFELTSGAKILMTKHKLDAVICIGCVIKGETAHNEYINQAVAQGLTQLGMLSNVPCIFGLLTPNTEQQALDRAGGKHGNKGIEAAITALRMAAIKKDLKSAKKGIGFN